MHRIRCHSRVRTAPAGLSVIALAVALAAAKPPFAAAAAFACATSSTAAAGAPGYFKFVATSNAKTAWSRKVSRDQKLGGAYTRWSLAQSASVTCRQIARRYRCVASAEPCRRSDAASNQQTPRSAS